MTLPPLPDDAILLRAEVADWRDAVRAAGNALTRSGATLPGYSDRMIEVLEEFGAYIVIAPGLALAHARPGPDVRRSGLSVVTLAEPVAFGHPHNDPVRVVLGLAVSSAEEHVASVADLANVFNERDATDRIADAATPDEVRRVLRVAGEGRPATDAAGAPS
ncbi:PTS sugar transporter subunit IIA [Agromyces sp. GXQ0307]|uniref:PTS sugar transporter subunit IIA n=1 Tax=Agromyces sp. GXQ0307 TaxID=3377835 RepID=UPI00383B4CEF